jgi:poly-gamma-glutamate capsule biosynthesis protein CapA/YwtB (metallophosphatase superfamily)
VLGNLEGTLSTGGSSKCGAGSRNCFAFQTPPGYAKWLTRAGFTIVNLANNHAFDFGEQGLRQTIRALGRARLPHTGLPGQIEYLRAGDLTVAVIGFAAYPWAHDLLDVEGAAQLVRRADERADVVVVTMHGGAEGSDAQHQRAGPEVFLGEQRGDLVRFSHAVVDAGADLVAGHGPHVLRGMEWYRGRLIAYSLGNFAGFRVFNLSGPTAVSGILRVTLRRDGTYAAGRLIATVLDGPGIPRLDPREQAHGVVRQLSREDFGARGALISRTGWITPPGA